MTKHFRLSDDYQETEFATREELRAYVQRLIDMDCGYLQGYMRGYVESFDDRILQRYGLRWKESAKHALIEYVEQFSAELVSRISSAPVESATRLELRVIEGGAPTPRKEI